MDLEGTEAPLEDIWGMKDDEPYLEFKQEAMSDDECEVQPVVGKEPQVPKTPETKQTEEMEAKLKDPYACDRCNYKTKDFMTFITHKNKHQEEDKLKASLFTCGYCKFATPSPALMTEHIKSHLTATPGDTENENSSSPKNDTPSYDSSQDGDANCDNEIAVCLNHSSLDTDDENIDAEESNEENDGLASNKTEISVKNNDNSVLPAIGDSKGCNGDVGETVPSSHRGLDSSVEKAVEVGCIPEENEAVIQPDVVNSTVAKKPEIVRDLDSPITAQNNIANAKRVQISLDVSFCKNDESELPFLSKAIKSALANEDESVETECVNAIEVDAESELNSAPSTPESLTPIIPALTYGRRKKITSNEHSDQFSCISTSSEASNSQADDFALKWVSVKVARYQGPSVCIPRCDQVAESLLVVDTSINSTNTETQEEKVFTDSPSPLRHENANSPANVPGNMPVEAEEVALSSRSSTPCKSARKRKRQFLTTKSGRKRPTSSLHQSFSSNCLYELSQPDAVSAKFASDEGKQIIDTSEVKIVRESTNIPLSLATQIDSIEESKCELKNTTSETLNLGDKMSENEVALSVSRLKLPKHVRRKPRRKRKEKIAVANPVPTKSPKKPLLLSRTAMMAKVEEITNRQKTMVVKVDEKKIAMDLEQNGESCVKTELVGHAIESNLSEVSSDVEESTSIDTTKSFEAPLENLTTISPNLKTDNLNILNQTIAANDTLCAASSLSEDASKTITENAETAIESNSSQCDARDGCSQDMEPSLIHSNCEPGELTVLAPETNLVSTFPTLETPTSSTQDSTTCIDQPTKIESANDASEPAAVLEYLVTTVSAKLDLPSDISDETESFSNSDKLENQEPPVGIQNCSPVPFPGVVHAGDSDCIPESVSPTPTVVACGDFLQSEFESRMLNHFPTHGNDSDASVKNTEPLLSIENTYTTTNRPLNKKEPSAIKSLPVDPKICESTEAKVSTGEIANQCVEETSSIMMVEQPQLAGACSPSADATSNITPDKAQVDSTVPDECPESHSTPLLTSTQEPADQSQSGCETLPKKIHNLACGDILTVCDQAEKSTELRDVEEIARAVEAISEKDSCFNPNELQMENWLGKSLMENGCNSPSFENLPRCDKMEDSFRWVSGDISVRDDFGETERAVKAIMNNTEESVCSNMSSPEFIIKDSFSLRQTDSEFSTDYDCQACDEDSVSEIVEEPSPCNCVSDSFLKLMKGMLIDVDCKPVFGRSVFSTAALNLGSSQPLKKPESCIGTAGAGQLRELNSSTKRSTDSTVAPMRMHKKPKRDIILRYENELNSKAPHSDSASHHEPSIGQAAVGEKTWELNNNNNNDSSCANGLEFPTDILIENRSHPINNSFSSIIPRQRFDNYHPKKKLARCRSSAALKHPSKKRKRRMSDSRLCPQPIPTQNLGLPDSAHKKLYRCQFCEYATDSKVDLFSHSNRIHSEEETVYMCDKCNYITYRQSKLTAHEKVHEEPDEFELEDQRLQAQQKRTHRAKMISACQRLANLGNGDSLASNVNAFKIRQPKKRRLHWKNLVYTQKA